MSMDEGSLLTAPGEEDLITEPSENSPEALLQRIGLGFLTGTAGLTFAFFVFVLGSVSGAYLDESVRSIDSGFFGPSLEELLERERFDENFSAIQKKLDRLSSSSSTEEIQSIRAELTELFDRQKGYVANLQGQVESSFVQNNRSKTALLKGVAPQSDFELQTNRAVTLGMRGTIFSTLRIYDDQSSRILVSLNGKKKSLSPGDQLRFTTEEEHCVISYVSGSSEKETTRFNMSCAPTE